MIKVYVFYFLEGLVIELRGIGVMVIVYCSGVIVIEFFRVFGNGEVVLFKSGFVVSGEEVVVYVYWVMMMGWVVVIYGVLNGIMIFLNCLSF